MGAVLVLAAGPVALGAAPTPEPTASPGVAGPGAASRAADRGTQLYLENCASCHGEQGQGAQRGPSLVGVGPASVDFQVATGRMPLSHEAQQARRREPVFSAADIAALVDHVASLSGGGPQIPRVAPGNPVSGREVFAANCAPCHGATGAGAALTNGWTAPPLYDATAVQIAEAVRVGPGLMPVFPSQVLDDRQVDDVTTYVRRLRGERMDRGGNPLDRLGPLAEGLVAWLATLGLLVAAARWLGRRAGE
ncbi:c-type cytochrome [Micromonospora sp. NBC_01655]|uniref:cytochrome bc1 complex diheme cytochrome c subunit n=1 Tax=Micromonospora sp. NBC_01655 TaxID=2975983 RepID=UPI00224DCF2E|nr:c-type cytochrome [Micromonospora sp. NBC_01655]MCX4471638.1 c-type cytochrome [Micromonospora sp. NBC_01655]